MKSFENCLKNLIVDSTFINFHLLNSVLLCKKITEQMLFTDNKRDNKKICKFHWYLTWQDHMQIIYYILLDIRWFWYSAFVGKQIH